MNFQEANDAMTSLCSSTGISRLTHYTLHEDEIRPLIKGEDKNSITFFVVNDNGTFKIHAFPSNWDKDQNHFPTSVGGGGPPFPVVIRTT